MTSEARQDAIKQEIEFELGTSAIAIMLGNTVRFTGDALSANTNEEQTRLSASGLNSIGKFGAGLIETTPALIMGAGGGYMLSSRVGALDSLASAMRNTAEYRLRMLMPERFYYSTR